MFKKPIVNDTINVYVLNNKIKNKAFFAILSKAETEKYKKFKNSQSAYEFYAGKILTRKIISSITGVKPEKIIFKTSKYDRPELVYPIIKNFDFNLSHSNGAVVLAVANNKVGVDIEKIKPIEFSIYKNYFTEEESKYIFNAKKNYLNRFYEIWTLKEAYAKANGRGISQNLCNFHFEVKKGLISLTIRKKEKKCFFKNFIINNNYCISLCSMSEIKKIKFIKYQI